MRASLPVGISIELADGWLDITDDLPPDAPFTLARIDGVGSFQFSAATYARGVMPNARVEQLRDMPLAFGRDRKLGAPFDICVFEERVFTVGGSFDGVDFIRAWYVSDGRSFISASHTSGQHAPEELEACESMIRSVAFNTA